MKAVKKKNKKRTSLGLTEALMILDALPIEQTNGVDWAQLYQDVAMHDHYERHGFMGMNLEQLAALPDSAIPEQRKKIAEVLGLVPKAHRARLREAIVVAGEHHAEAVQKDIDLGGELIRAAIGSARSRAPADGHWFRQMINREEASSTALRTTLMAVSMMRGASIYQAMDAIPDSLCALTTPKKMRVATPNDGTGHAVATPTPIRVASGAAAGA